MKPVSHSEKGAKSRGAAQAAPLYSEGMDQEPWRIWTNFLFTRRKSFFAVTDQTGEVVFRNRWFWPCVEWLDLNDVKEYEIVPAGEQSVHVKRLSVQTKD